MKLIDKIINKAKTNIKHIVLPESDDDRILEAADLLIRDKVAKLTLIGDEATILSRAKELKLTELDKVTIVNPKNHVNKIKYIDLLFDLRKEKGMTKEKAAELVENHLYLSSLMVKSGDIDGEVAGAKNATGDVLRPALQLIKTTKGISTVSGSFIMETGLKEYGHDGIFIFADCAVNPLPNEQQLAEIAISSAKTVRDICGFEPKVAMLSFSTKGSATNELVDKMVNATNLVKKTDPSLKIDGELQADAAIVPSVAKKKAPDSIIAGNANVLIFPSLEAGNIAYKLVQRLARAEALGPILQGLAKPVNDLSRGCSVDDIYKLVAITSTQAASKQLV